MKTNHCCLYLFFNESEMFSQLVLPHWIFKCWMNCHVSTFLWWGIGSWMHLPKCFVSQMSIWKLFINSVMQSGQLEKLYMNWSNTKNIIWLVFQGRIYVIAVTYPSGTFNTRIWDNLSSYFHHRIIFIVSSQNCHCAYVHEHMF